MKKALCVKYEDVFKIPRQELGKQNIIKEASSIFSKEAFLFDRAVCETDENYLQIIPYVTLIDEDTNDVFMYTRGSASNEKRLTARTSIGVGGHIESLPQKHEILLDAIVDGTVRELNEEVGLPITNSLFRLINNKFMDNDFGCFYCNETAVDKVHIGLSLIISVPRYLISEAEKDIITRSTWLSINDIRSKITSKEIELENWSILIFELLEGRFNS